MLIERWHKRLKHEYVKTGKGSIRMDALVDLLVSTPETMEEDRRIKMARGLNAGRSRLLQHHRAHDIAVKMYGARPEAVQVLGEGRWCITDASGTHHIKQSICICDEKINNHCKKCSACAYAFSCDCAHDSMSGVSCAHIHAALLHGSAGLFRDDLQVDEDVPIAEEIELHTNLHTAKQKEKTTVESFQRNS
ncbi:hypothetical protein Q1695_003129 [Nippostrongylus brasiliensis]|nr:hypothetical protein Q1695_003129 [Nippostrongylus brasiliensis]